MAKVEYVIKRNGDKVPFNRNRIVNALYRAAIAVGGRDRELAEKLTEQIVKKLHEDFTADNIPHIEEIQDTVEYILN